MLRHQLTTIGILLLSIVTIYALPQGTTSSSNTETDPDSRKIYPDGYRLDANGFRTIEPGLYCRKAAVQDILLFFLLNYVTHAFTLKSFPGDGAIYSISLSILSLLFPYAGILKAWDSIRSGTLRKKPDLDRAREAGALCVVGRDYGWKPKSEGGERIWCWNTTKDVRGRVSTWASLIGEADRAEIGDDDGLEGGRRYTRGSSRDGDKTKRAPIPKVSLTFDDPHPLLPLNPKHVSLHGQVKLPDGYRLLTLPFNIPVVPIHDNPAPPTTLAFSHNWPKAITSIVQLVFSCITLYRAGGAQFKLYGYASSSLTLVPYMLMTFLNLLSHIFTPDFPAVYLVHTGVMDEARARGGIFQGVIGRIDLDRVEDCVKNDDDSEMNIPGFPVHFREKDLQNGQRAYVVGFDSKPGTPMGFRPEHKKPGLEEIQEKNHQQSRQSDDWERRQQQYRAQNEQEMQTRRDYSHPRQSNQDSLQLPYNSQDQHPRISVDREDRSSYRSSQDRQRPPPHQQLHSSQTSNHPQRRSNSRHRSDSSTHPQRSSSNHRHSNSQTNTHPTRASAPILAPSPASYPGSRPVSELIPHPSQQSRFAGPAAFLEAILDIPYVVVAAPTKSDSWLKKHVFHRDTFKAEAMRPPQPVLLLSCLSLPPTPPAHKRWYSPRSRWFRGFLIIWLIIVPYLVIYGFTRFDPGEKSTAQQRGWILAWLSMGQILGLGMVGVWKEWRGIGENWKDRWKGGWGALCVLAYAVPALGGMVQVGEMLREGGICEWIN